MTLASLFSDITIFALLLLVGFFIREVIKPLQKLFLPASIIGGFVALLLGPQVFKVIEIPQSFAGLSGILINIIVPGLVFGITVNRKTIASYLDYSAIAQGSYGLQMALCVGLGSLLTIFWPALPKGWGIIGLFSFHGGHGDAMAAGKIFEGLGVQGTVAIGMVLSTFGLILGILIGMVFINIGARKGWTTFVKEPKKQPSWFYGGILPENQQSSIGNQTTTSFSINHLAFQLAWLLLCIWIGKGVISISSLVWKDASKLPAVIQGVIGAVILWPILGKLKLDRFVDTKTIRHICGFLLEIVVLCAIATLDLKIVTTLFVPIMIFTIIIVVANIMFVFFFGKLLCKEQWFEKTMMCLGMTLGCTATGLALVRACDPDNESCAPDANGVYAALFFWKYIFLALTPIWLMKGPWLTIIVGIIMCIASLLMGYFGNIIGRKSEKIN